MLLMEEMPVILKGTPQGILMQPKVDSWTRVLAALEHALADSGTFFRGGRVIVELGPRPLAEDDLLAMRRILDAYDLELWAVLTEDEAVQRTIRAYGIRTRLPGTTAPPQEAESVAGCGDAMFVQRNLRSGQRVQFPGHVTVLGDVHAGAEVIAGGNVIVWGHVRGMVHAGALGDESCSVCALELTPSQLRIASYIGRTPDGRRRKVSPEIARVRDGQIVAEPWTARG